MEYIRKNIFVSNFQENWMESFFLAFLSEGIIYSWSLSADNGHYYARFDKIEF